MKATSVNVSDFIDGPYKEYSKYVLYSRAIPNLIDGLKPSQRKILYTATRVASGKSIKTASLGGDVISKANYHHGDASLNAAITGMAQTFNNNLPLLLGEGSFGSRLVPEASAARYTHVRLNENFGKYFIDNDILKASPDMEDPEPQTYLPVIPWVLVNGIRGIAVGFATEIQPRDPKLLAKVCKDYIAGKNIDKVELPPHYESFHGKIQKNDKDQWECVGSYTLSGLKLRITEVPLGYDLEKYVAILDKLQAEGKIANYIEDNKSKSGFDFHITLRRGSKLTKNKIITTFKLRKTLNENLTVIDENGNLKIFDNPIDMVKQFCDYRLSLYQARYEWYGERDQNKMHLLHDKSCFIRMILDGVVDLKKTSAKKLRDLLDGKGFIYIEECIRMPIYKFCEDERKDLMSRIKELKNNISKWEKMNHTKAFTEDLNNVKS